MWLVNARDVKHLPGRSKTDRLDCVWLCKLNEWGMLRRSFVPPEPVRDLRALTRLRANLTHDRVRHQNRIEKILEDALLKVSSVISDLMGASGRRFLQALVDGERSPAALAALGDYRLRASKAELKEALTGGFRDIHAFEIGMLLELIDELTAKIIRLDEQITAQLEVIPGLGGVCTSCGQAGPDGPCTGCGELVLGVIARLDEITGIGHDAAQVIVAELGTDMSQFPTPGHAASWAKLTPRAIQSGATSKTGRTGKGDPYLRGVAGAAVMSAAKTGTFLGARYRRHARRRGKQKAIVAGSRTIIETAYRIIADPGFRYIELGSGYHDQLDAGRKTRDKIRQLEKLNPGMTVTLTPRRPDTQPGGPRRAGTRRLTTVRIPPVTRYQRGWRNRLTYYRSSPAAPGSLAPEGGWSLPERTALFPVRMSSADSDACCGGQVPKPAGGRVAVHPRAPAVEENRAAVAARGSAVDGAPDGGRQGARTTLLPLPQTCSTRWPCSSPISLMSVPVASKIRRPSRPSRPGIDMSAKSLLLAESPAVVSSASNCRRVNPGVGDSAGTAGRRTYSAGECASTPRSRMSGKTRRSPAGAVTRPAAGTGAPLASTGRTAPAAGARPRAGPGRAQRTSRDRSAGRTRRGSALCPCSCGMSERVRCTVPVGHE